MRHTRPTIALRHPSERGAALVEFAMVILLLFGISMGMIEYGRAYQGQENTLAATRSGVRATSSLGRDDLADFEALSSLKADLASSGMLDQVQLVVIYKSPSASDGNPPASCITGVASAELCNVFSGNQLRALSKTTFNTNASGTGTGCSTASVSSRWCPNIRIDNQLQADYVGVYVKVKHPFITKYFGSDMTITQRSVMRIEPSGS